MPHAHDPYLAFTDVRDHLRAMALVHGTPYRPDIRSRVDFSSHRHTLAGGLRQACGLARRVSVHITVDVAALPVDRMVPCGMTICERLTDAFQHVFSGPGARRHHD